jgi:hypothetical protein
MVLTYHPEHRKITSNMSGYTKGCIEEFEQKNPSQKIKIVTTPATDIFFRTRKETDLEPMCKHRVAQFHSTIAKSNKSRIFKGTIGYDLMISCKNLDTLIW